MIRINIIPPFTSSTSSHEIMRDLVIASAVLGVVYYTPVYLAQMNETAAQETLAHVAAKREELRKLQLDFGKLADLQKQLVDVQRRGDQIRSLSEGRQLPIMALDRLQQTHIGRLWFDELNLKGRKVSVKGTAVDLLTVSVYTKKLKGLTSEDDDSPTDFKNFTPGLTGDGKSGEPEPRRKIKSNEKVNFSGLILRKSLLEDVEGIPLQKFEIDFNY